MGAIITAALIWIFLSIAGTYFSQFRLRLTRMQTWLRDQYPTLQNESTYRKEAQAIWNVYIPGIDQLLDENRQFMNATWVFQGLNAFLVFQLLIGHHLPLLMFMVATGTASIFVALRKTRKRRYAVEGTCRGVQSNVEALKLQKERGEL